MEQRASRMLAVVVSMLGSGCVIDPDLDSTPDEGAVAEALSSPSVAHWKFDETGGTSAADSTGNGRTGSLTSGASFAAGRLGNAVYLNGAAEVTVADHASLDPGTADFSITGWMRSNQTSQQYVISKRTFCYHSSFWNLMVNHVAGKLSVEVDGAAGANYRLLNGAKTVNDSAWHHFAVVRQGTSLKLYVDGSLDASGTTAAATNISNGSKLSFGKNVCGGNFVGWLDDVRHYGLALSASDVSGLAAAAADTTAPTVSITAPASNTTVTSAQTVTLAATASDNVAVTKVEFYDGTTLRHTDTSSPFTYGWSVGSANNGAHAVTAKAYDAAGNHATSATRTLTVNIAQSCVGRLIVQPVLYMPSDAVLSASSQASALTLLDQHVALARDFYLDLLDTDTFCIEPASVYHAYARGTDVQYAGPDHAHGMALSLLNWRGETRTSSRRIFVAVFVRPSSATCVFGGAVPNNCFGGARPLNGGVGTGGGFVQMEYSSLVNETPYAFQSTVVHEIGHALGLAHGDCNGESMSTGFSIMTYNLSHKSSGLQLSATPGGFIPEQYYLLDKNNLAFPNFSYVSSVHNPTNKTLTKVDGQCNLATMGHILDVAGAHAGYDLYWGDSSQNFDLMGHVDNFTIDDARANCQWNMTTYPTLPVLCLYNGDVIGSRI